MFVTRIAKVLTVAFVVMAFAMVASSCCYAGGWSWTMDSAFQRISEDSGDIPGVHLYSTATFDGISTYTYNYRLVYAAGGTPVIHLFSIGNIGNASFYNAENNYHFTNPEFVPGSIGGEIKWFGGYLTAGNEAQFSFTSAYGPCEIPVFAYCQNGGNAVAGEAFGPASMVPEPGALVGMLVSLTGMAVGFAKRRK